MTLYLLNHFPTVGLVLLIVGGTTALAIVVTIVVHKLFPNLADSRFEELTGIMRADVFALLYTIVLALVISQGHRQSRVVVITFFFDHLVRRRGV